MRELVNSWTRKDFKIEWFSGQGAGGQHRNKHQNCCRITHIESGLVTTGQSHRERKRNFEEAFQELARRVVQHYHPEELRDRAPATEVVRTYNMATNLVTDHSSGHKIRYEDLDMDEMIKARKEVKER